MRFSSFVLVATLLAVGSANPMDRRAMVVHESVKAVPSGFAHAGAVSPAQQITLRIALAQSDITGLQAKTYAVSDPASALYGQHLTVDEVRIRISPSPRSPTHRPPLDAHIRAAHGGDHLSGL
jgi:tripeptidyl-peptidase-1